MRSGPIAGIDTGVKGSVVLLDGPELSYRAWDLTGVGVHQDRLYSAVARGGNAAAIVLEFLGEAATQVPVGFDVPVFMAGKNAYGWGLQTAMYAALQVALEGRGVHVVPVKGVAARRILGVTGRGKAGIIEWAQNRNLDWRLPLGPGWKRETVAEALMLAEAARIQGGIAA